jgi:hypothetical protein
VQIARTASDADTLATTIRYAVHLDRRSCGERQDFVTISTDPYPTFARLREEAPLPQMMHTLPVPWADPIDISNAVLFLALMNLVTSQAFRFPSTRAAYSNNQQPSREKANA